MQTIIDETKAAELYKAEWNASPEIRIEFGGNYEPYAAFRKAEDQGLIGGTPSKKHRLSTLQIIEMIKLQYETDPYLRDRWRSFDAFRKHRWAEEMVGR